jgi:repressor LexA
MKLPKIREALNVALSIDTLDYCTCDCDWIDWSSDKCGYCTLQDALRELDCAESQGKTGHPSQRQRRLLVFIDQYHSEHGYPPTLREMSRALDDCATSTISWHLRRLEQMGYVERTFHAARSVRFLIPPEKW